MCGLMVSSSSSGWRLTLVAGDAVEPVVAGTTPLRYGTFSPIFDLASSLSTAMMLGVDRMLVFDRVASAWIRTPYDGMLLPAPFAPNRLPRPVIGAPNSPPSKP